MPIVPLSGHERLELRRGDVVVRIDVASPDPLRVCLESVLTHTAPAAARLLVVGGGSAEIEPLVAQALTATGATHEVLVAVDAAIELAPADVVRLAGDRVVAPGWLERLGEAARGDPRTANASASDGERDAELAAPAPGCVWIRRAALELVGGCADGDLEGFGARCVARGLRHLAVAGVLGRAGAGRSVANGLSVTIDGRCLSTSVTGTAVAVLELAAGLGAHPDVTVRVLVLDDLADGLRALVTGTGATPVTVEQAQRAGPTDIAHRPYQLGVADDLSVLHRLGRRIVVTHLDSIAYRTAAYFEDGARWQEYRALARTALAAADRVVLLSEDAAADARALGLVDSERTAVIALATDDPLAAARSSAEDPAAPEGVERPYLLCLGTDFAHKNRPFAIRLLGALREREGFDGGLVLAGPHVAVGSSAAEEAAVLAASPGLGEHVVDLGEVGEGEKRRLIRDAAAVVYPTTFEGFGLVPFEAARAGVPVLFAWTSSLRDHLPAELELLVPWDVDASAHRVAPVLVAGEARDRQVRATAAAGAPLTTAENARRHVELYRAALAGPRRAMTEVALDRLRLDAERRRLTDERDRACGELAAIDADPVARGLVGRHAVVPEELRRAVLALAMRPALRDGAVALYRAARRVRGRL